MPSFWSRRTPLEKGLIIVVGVVTVLAAVLLIAIVVMLLRPAASLRSGVSYIQNTTEIIDDIRICTTTDCIYIASKLLSDLDENVDPCDDFYDFACGSFLKNASIPDDQQALAAHFVDGNYVQKQIRSVLEEAITSDEPRPFVLAKKLYQACMNTTAIEARGTQPLLDLLLKLGGWPVLQGHAWNESNFSWMDSVHHSRILGLSFNYFLHFSVIIDKMNTTRRIISLDEALLSLDREYLIHGFSDKLVLAYYDYMVDIAKLLGAEKSQAEVEMKDSLQFEMNLASISISREKKRNVTNVYNPTRIAELISKFPSIPWLQYINGLLAPQVTVGPEEITIVTVPKYFSDLEKLLSVTPKRVQANYVMWRVAADSISYLTEALRHRQLVFSTAQLGKSERESRWQECSDAAEVIMPIAVGAMYVRKYFSETTKAIALELVNDIRQQFRKILTELDWLDNQTRNEALDKADSMASHIAYPEELLDNNKLTEYYSKLEVSSDNWLESRLNVTLFDIDFFFSELRKPVNRTDWVYHGRSARFEATYMVEENSMVIPAAVLQANFFSPNRSAYMNYGAIGSIIGHEITHGFDDEGRQYDKNGNLVDWWQESSKLKYLKKTKCIIDQYSNYTVTQVGLKVNGMLTQGENIADNGGTKTAYYAYQALTKRHGDEPRLPGLEKYTPEQLFWLSEANYMCAIFRDEFLKTYVTTFAHAPKNVRVIGSMSNMKEFAQDYKCPVGSRMNPQKKCQVW